MQTGGKRKVSYNLFMISIYDGEREREREIWSRRMRVMMEIWLEAQGWRGVGSVICGMGG